MSHRDEFERHAIETPFDPSNCVVITKENTQEAIEELCGKVEDALLTSSPGFTWGDSGSIKNSYLLNDTVPSNKAGRISPVTGFITTVFLSNSADDKTFDVEIRRREPAGTFTTIATMTVVNARVKIDDTFNVVVSFGDELACYISGAGNNSAQSPVVGLIIKGT